jgi:hypothetical protein
MDIFLSVNNRAEVMQLPVVPPEFTVSKPQGNSTFETINSGELNLYGEPKLKTISWSSFFPSKNYPFLKNRSMWGYEYIKKLDSWISQKLPIRLIITGTPINMAVLIDSLDFTVSQNGDYAYSISMSDMPMPQIIKRS